MRGSIPPRDRISPQLLMLFRVKLANAKEANSLSRHVRHILVVVVVVVVVVNMVVVN